MQEGEAIKKSPYSEEQVAYALRLAESGTPAGDVCRQMGIAQAILVRMRPRRKKRLSLHRGHLEGPRPRRMSQRQRLRLQDYNDQRPTVPLVG